MLFIIIIATGIIFFLICWLYKKENSISIIRWLYSGKHPQQKYYRSLYKASEERRKELEKERIKKNGEYK